jgi:hypothetical protein
MTSLNDLKNNPMVLYPPVSGSIIHQSREPVIYLAGSMTGLLVERTWHQTIIEKLDFFGFEGKVYIPSRLDITTITDYTQAKKLEEEKNNLYMEERSFAVVYWGGDIHEPEALKHLLSLVWKSSHIKITERKRPLIFFGANEGSRALKEFDLLSRHTRIYYQLSQIANDVVDKVNLVAML